MTETDQLIIDGICSGSYKRLFKKADVLEYIENGYGIFHCEGDEAVLEDITEFLNRKGIKRYG